MPAGSRPSPSARWSPASLTPLTHSVSLSTLRLFCSTPFAPCAGRLPGDMFRSSTRLSTGAPCRTANARDGCPYPALGTGSGLPCGSHRVRCAITDAVPGPAPEPSARGRPPVRAAHPLRTPDRLPDDISRTGAPSSES